MSSLWIFVASLLTGADSGALGATDVDAGQIFSLSTDSCPLGRAPEIDLMTAIRDYARLRGRCVAVRGWNRGGSIYPSREAALADAPPVGNALGRLGIYGDEEALAALSSEPREVLAAGMIGACEVINQGEGAAGYCHSVLEGGFLILGELRSRR